MHSYQHNIKTFNNATRHLTRVERSLYRDAIELYYDTEKPLTSDKNRLERLLICTTEEEKNALEYVLSEFFQLTEEGYTHSFCDFVIQEYKEQLQKKINAGKASARARLKNEKQKTNKTETQHEQKSTDVEQAFNECSTNQKTENRKQKTPIKEKKETPAARFDPKAIELPDCINSGTWEAWIDYRRERKLTVKETTMVAQLAKLQDMFNNGHNPNNVITESITNGWQGLFEPKGKAAKNTDEEKNRVREEARQMLFGKQDHFLSNFGG